jgi:hypothetical protein
MKKILILTGSDFQVTKPLMEELESKLNEKLEVIQIAPKFLTDDNCEIEPLEGMEISEENIIPNATVLTGKTHTISEFLENPEWNVNEVCFMLEDNYKVAFYIIINTSSERAITYNKYNSCWEEVLDVVFETKKL